MAASPRSTATEPRYFARRMLAFLLDFVLAHLLVVAIFWSIHTATGVSIGDFTSAEAQSECAPAPANHAQVLRVEAMWPLPAGSRRENVICRTVDGEGESLTFTTRVITEEGSTTYTTTAVYPIDRDGKALPIEYTNDPSTWLVLLCFMVFAAFGWKTPGKAIMGLVVMTEAGEIPAWSRALMREALRFLPLLIYGIMVLWVNAAKPAMLTDSERIIIQFRDGGMFGPPLVLIWIFLAAGMLVWWFAPFVFWRGRTWYDALSGTVMMITDCRKPSEPPPA